MAVWTPRAFASYEQASTTPPPTSTGLPRNLGSSRCSTDAKNASRSAWRMVASATDTNRCSHRAPTERPRLALVPARGEAGAGADPARPQRGVADESGMEEGVHDLEGRGPRTP